MPLKGLRAMIRYANRGGDSNVLAYESTPGQIVVRFGDDSAYLYTDQSAGADNIARMHALATAGKGLNSFIGRYVAKRYAAKLK